jgi:hypothetical protein
MAEGELPAALSVEQVIIYRISNAREPVFTAISGNTVLGNLNSV